MRPKILSFFTILPLMLVLLWQFYIINSQLGSCVRHQQARNSRQHQPNVSTVSATIASAAAASNSTAVANKTASQKKKIDPKLASLGSVCQDRRCVPLYHPVYHGTERIPTIRHILWKGDNVSDYMAKKLGTWHTQHPDWKYVLWRDADLFKFVAKHYTAILSKFKSLSDNIMRLDLIRYMILHHFGGVYADLDYSLAQPLDPFLKFPAVVTRESEAHEFFHFGFDKFPPPVLGSPAFMMSEPGHPFFHYCVIHLACRAAGHYYSFAGPMGLTDMLVQYAKEFPLEENPDGVVLVPVSRSFYPLENNSLATSSTKGFIIPKLQRFCEDIKKKKTQVASNVTAFCRDPSNLDPVTDRNDPIYAIHDIFKSSSSYAGGAPAEFYASPVDIRSVLPNLVMADAMF